MKGEILMYCPKCGNEVGPGQQLGSILKCCNRQAWKSYSHVDVMQNIMDPDP